MLGFRKDTQKEKDNSGSLRSGSDMTGSLSTAVPTPAHGGGQHLEQTHVTPEEGKQPEREGGSSSKKAANETVPVRRGRIDLSQLTAEYPMLQQAVTNYSAIEQEDITPEEFAKLREGRNRFMPLFGRFALAHNTTLKVGVANRGITGDFAVTRLRCLTNAGKWLEYDNDKAAFLAARDSREITEFKVEVLFNSQLAKGAPSQDAYSLKRVGVIQQAFTHEMAVHAENMLDFIEDYWAQRQSALPTASEEHQSFTKRRVARYEHMSNRSKQRNDIGSEFDRREVDDLRTAK